jgi:hypothetical protein
MFKEKQHEVTKVVLRGRCNERGQGREPRKWSGGHVVCPHCLAFGRDLPLVLPDSVLERLQKRLDDVTVHSHAQAVDVCGSKVPTRQHLF